MTTPSPVTPTPMATPRTDAFEADNESALKAGFNLWPNFARTLERELSAATQRAEAAEGLLNEIRHEEPVSISMRRHIFNHFERYHSTSTDNPKQ